MNKPLTIAVVAGLLASPSVFGQAAVQATNSSFQNRLNAIVRQASQPAEAPPILTKFDLDFPGGMPEQLVAAIEKSSGKPLNAIIPTEFDATFIACSVTCSS